MTKIKKKGITQLVTIIILTIIGIVLATVSFAVPFIPYRYVSFAEGIKLGIDLKGGVVAVYEASLPNDDDGSGGTLDSRINSTMKRIESLLFNKGYTEAQVSKQGTSRIRVEVADVEDPETIFKLIGEPADLVITNVEKRSQITDSSEKITGRNVSKVEYAYDSQKGQHGVSIEFDSKGAEIFAKLTKDLAASKQPLYIHLFGEEEDAFSSATVEEAITGNKTFISGGKITSKETAEEYALQILSGTYSVNLKVDQNTVVSAQLGVDALKWGIIAGVIGLLLIFLFMGLFYKRLGLISCLSLSIYAVLLLLLLNIVPLVQLTLPGIAGIVLSLGMAVDGNVIIFERIKDEYRNGKKMNVAFNDGFKHSISAIFDGNVTTLIAALVLTIFGTGAVKGFAITLLIGIALSLFVSLVINKWLLNITLKINSTDSQKYSLKRRVTEKCELQKSI